MQVNSPLVLKGWPRVLSDPVLVIRSEGLVVGVFFPPFYLFVCFFGVGFFFPPFSADGGSEYFCFLLLTCDPRSVSCVVFFCFKVRFG